MERSNQTYAVRKKATRLELKKQILEHCGTVCANCGSDRDVEYHHIVPLSNGGSIRPSNVVALCTICHLKAHGKLKYYNSWTCKYEMKMDKPENADVTIEKFLKGEISKYDVYEEWGIADKVLHQISFFNRYLNRHNIVSYRNFINLVKNRRANTSKDDKEYTYLASIIIYRDGIEERYYRTMKNGNVVTVTKETKQERDVDRE